MADTMATAKTSTKVTWFSCNCGRARVASPRAPGRETLPPPRQPRGASPTSQMMPCRPAPFPGRMIMITTQVCARRELATGSFTQVLHRHPYAAGPVAGARIPQPADSTTELPVVSLSDDSALVEAIRRSHLETAHAERTIDHQQRLAGGRFPGTFTDFEPHALKSRSVSRPSRPAARARSTRLRRSPRSRSAAPPAWPPDN